MAYIPITTPITKKMANFKRTNIRDDDMDINFVGGIDEVYSQRLRTAGIYTVAQLKCKTKCMSQCEFEIFLKETACMYKQHAGMAYKCIYGRVSQDEINKALSKKTKKAKRC